MKRSDLKKYDILICKKDYTCNGFFQKNDKFIVESTKNHYYIILKTPIGTYHNIPYGETKFTLFNLDKLFYSKLELRELKIKKLKRNLNI